MLQRAGTTVGKTSTQAAHQPHHQQLQHPHQPPGVSSAPLPPCGALLGPQQPQQCDHQQQQQQQQQQLPPDWLAMRALGGMTDFVVVPILRGDTPIGALQVRASSAATRAGSPGRHALVAALFAAWFTACWPQHTRRARPTQIRTDLEHHACNLLHGRISWGCTAQVADRCTPPEDNPGAVLPSRKCRGVAELSILGAVIASQLVVGYML